MRYSIQQNRGGERWHAELVPRMGTFNVLPASVCTHVLTWRISLAIPTKTGLTHSLWLRNPTSRCRLSEVLLTENSLGKKAAFGLQFRGVRSVMMEKVPWQGYAAERWQEWNLAGKISNPVHSDLLSPVTLHLLSSKTEPTAGDPRVQTHESVCTGHSFTLSHKTRQARFTFNK